MWQPSRPLTAAERRVNFAAHDSHINDYQHRVEKAARFTLRRVSASLVRSGYPSTLLVARLERQIVDELDRTALFGYRHAQQEIAAMRATSKRPPSDAHRLALARRGTPRAVPDAGRYGTLALQGLPGVFDLVRHRAHDAMVAVVTAGATALQNAGADATANAAAREATTAAVLVAATKQMHRSVIELVGETLNLGRTVGALRYPREQGGAPEFALRSEQLDRRTCGPCDQLHGTITRVGSGEYFDYLPPSGCSGGGRCRGIEVFSDGPDDVRGPDTAPGLQPPLRPLGPDLF